MVRAGRSVGKYCFSTHARALLLGMYRVLSIGLRHKLPVDNLLNAQVLCG